MSVKTQIEQFLEKFPLSKQKDLVKNFPNETYKYLSKVASNWRKENKGRFEHEYPEITEEELNRIMVEEEIEKIKQNKNPGRITWDLIEDAIYRRLCTVKPTVEISKLAMEFQKQKDKELYYLLECLRYITMDSDNRSYKRFSKVLYRTIDKNRGCKLREDELVLEMNKCQDIDRKGNWLGKPNQRQYHNGDSNTSGIPAFEDGCTFFYNPNRF